MSALLLDDIGLCLLRRIDEAEDDVRAIQELPVDMRMGSAFMDGFMRIGIRDQLVRELVAYLVIIPCEGVDTTKYQAARWTQRDVCAHEIVLRIKAQR